LDINPRHIGAWFNLGVIVSGFGRYRDSLDFFDTALELKPNAAEIWYMKSLILKNLKRSNEAFECLEMALRLDPRLLLINKSKNFI